MIMLKRQTGNRESYFEIRISTLEDDGDVNALINDVVGRRGR